MDNNKYYLDLLIDLIINNAKMDYLDRDLRIDDDRAIIQVVKIIAKTKYEKKLSELKEQEGNNGTTQPLK